MFSIWGDLNKQPHVAASVGKPSKGPKLWAFFFTFFFLGLWSTVICPIWYARSIKKLAVSGDADSGNKGVTHLLNKFKPWVAHFPPELTAVGVMSLSSKPVETQP